MKRFAIIIGCSGLGKEYRPGIEKDVDNFVEYLQSNKGGAWNDEEIIPLKNETKATILNVINDARNNYDYVLVVFSGHGNYNPIKETRRLYTNNGEFIYESGVLGISSKQLTIIDSCACVEREAIVDSLTKSILFASEGLDNRRVYRKLFDNWVDSCPDQSIVMYSCEEGEESSDSDNGGLYAYNLLVAAKNTNEELSCLKVHEIAKPKVVETAKKKGEQQHPTYYSTCKHGNVLPFSIGK
jgi:hypothetical protein